MRYEEIDRRARAREYEANSRVARQAHSDARAARPDPSARTAQPWGCGGPVPPRRPPEGALRPTIGLPKSALQWRARAIQAFLGGLALVSNQSVRPASRLATSLKTSFFKKACPGFVDPAWASGL